MFALTCGKEQNKDSNKNNNENKEVQDEEKMAGKKTGKEAAVKMHGCGLFADELSNLSMGINLIAEIFLFPLLEKILERVKEFLI